VLVTFEGLDGAGKSSLMREVAAGLRGSLPAPVLQLPDISASPTGRRLVDVFRAEDLFGNVDSTVISRCLAAAADLFYFDGALIAPMVATGGLVLKERHVDTLISHEAPVLARRCGWSEERACAWLSAMVEPLQVRPSLTILVEAPRVDRERRLCERQRQAGAVLGPSEAKIARAVFRTRAAWYERLRALEENRWVSVANPDGDRSRTVAQAIAAICDRRHGPGALPQRFAHATALERET